MPGEGGIDAEESGLSACLQYDPWGTRHWVFTRAGSDRSSQAIINGVDLLLEIRRKLILLLGSLSAAAVVGAAILFYSAPRWILLAVTIPFLVELTAPGLGHFFRIPRHWMRVLNYLAASVVLLLAGEPSGLSGSFLGLALVAVVLAWTLRSYQGQFGPRLELPDDIFESHTSRSRTLAVVRTNLFGIGVATDALQWVRTEWLVGLRPPLIYRGANLLVRSGGPVAVLRRLSLRGHRTASGVELALDSLDREMKAAVSVAIAALRTEADEGAGPRILREVSEAPFIDDALEELN